jgi:hypothetical protein
MMCVPGKIREFMLEEVYPNSRLGLTLLTDGKHLQVKCNICGERLQASSPQSHLKTQHDMYRLFVFNRELTAEAPTTFLPASTQPPVSTTARYPVALVW